MGAEVIDPGGVAFGLDVVAVALGVFGLQVAVLVGQGLPQVEEDAAFFERDGGKLVVDLAQALFVEARVRGPDFRPHRRDGLDVDLRVGQGLCDHVQHEAVVGEEAGIIAVPVEHVGAEQDVEHLWLLGRQHLHRDLLDAVPAGAGGAVDHGVGADAFIGVEGGFRQAGAVDLHPLRQAVAQKTGVIEIAAVHGRAFGQRGQTEIHGGGAVGAELYRQPPGGRVVDGVPLAALQLLLEDGRPLHGGGGVLPVEPFPQCAHDAHQHQQEEQPCNGEGPEPALAEDPAAVFLIIGHKTPCFL